MTPTATPLECFVDAAAYALLAYAYPSDVEIRSQAAVSADLVDVNYIDKLGQLLELNPGIRPDTARLHLALYFVEHVRHAADTGAEPRDGILASGKPADALGRDPDRDMPD